MNVYNGWEEDTGKNHEKTKHPLSQERVSEDFPRLNYQRYPFAGAGKPLTGHLVDINICLL